MMNEQQQKAILGLSLMAAFADDDKHAREREEIKRIAEALGSEGTLNVAALYQDVLLKRIDMASAAAALTTHESRLLAYEMAVCVCDADDVQSAAERAFLDALRKELGLDTQQVQAHVVRAEAIAALPVGAAASGTASAVDEAGLDQAILNASILNGALELLPESLATMAIIPLQMKLVYRVGKSYGFELDRGHIKDFLATAGVGMTSQYLEQAGRKLLGGLLGAIGGGLLRGVGRQAVSSGMSFASTYALGHVAKRYYAGGRVLSTQMLRDAFASMLDEAKGMRQRHLPEIEAKARTLDLGSLLDTVRNA